MEAHFAKREADVRTLSVKLETDAVSGETLASLDVLSERLARLPSKAFLISVDAIQYGVLSAVVLFRDELKALIGT